MKNERKNAKAIKYTMRHMPILVSTFKCNWIMYDELRMMMMRDHSVWLQET